MKPVDAYEMKPHCDLSVTTLEEAAQRLGATFVYTLTVAPTSVVWVRNFLRKLAVEVKDTPLAPYINLCTDYSYEGYEWSLAANLSTVWSPGA